MAPPSSQPESTPQSFHKQLSSTSVALICVFFVCFFAITYLSAKTSRSTARPPLLSAPSRPRRFAAERRRPRIWETWLDKHFGETVHNWSPLAAWYNDGPRRADPRQETTMDHHIALAQAWIGRARPFRRERREAIQFSAPSPPVLPPDSDPRILNVAVLVAMPRRDPQSVTGSMLHPSDRSELLKDEGELALGVTGLLYEQVTQEDERTT